LFKNVEPRRLKVDGTSYQIAAGTGDTLTSNALDTQNYNEVSFQFLFGAITASAVVTIKLQHSTDDGATDAYADIAGTSQTLPVADAQKMILSSIYRPTKRYLKTIITRATANAAIDGVVAYLNLPANAPVSFGATVSGTPEFFNSPASGTA
jgi:hypothetical protein